VLKSAPCRDRHCPVRHRSVPVHRGRVPRRARPRRVERRVADTLRGFDSATLAVRLLSSPEFRLLHDALREGRDTGRDPDVQEHALAGLGAADRFVSLAYEYLLGRAADDGGRAHYAEAVRRGDSRTSVLRSLLLSPEFADRFRRVAPQGGFVPRDTQLCELANPAKWDNPEVGGAPAKPGPPRRQDIDASEGLRIRPARLRLKTLGLLRDDVSVLSVGAGHERCSTGWPNHVGRVSPPTCTRGLAERFSRAKAMPACCRRRGTTRRSPIATIGSCFFQMDGLDLGVRSGVMDVAYSLSSIEHFGGVEGAGRANRRDGPSDQTGRHPRARHGVRHPAALPTTRRSAAKSSTPLIPRPGLSLVGAFDRSVYTRYDYAAVDLYGNPHQTPHMVVRFNDTVFTTAFVFMRKT